MRNVEIHVLVLVVLLPNVMFSIIIPPVLVPLVIQEIHLAVVNPYHLNQHQVCSCKFYQPFFLILSLKTFQSPMIQWILAILHLVAQIQYATMDIALVYQNIMVIL